MVTRKRQPPILWALPLTVAVLLLLPLLFAAAHALLPHNRFFARRSANDLIGAKVDVPNPPFSVGALWSGAYQDAFTRYFAAHFPGRSDLIRLSNQIDYSAFKRSPNDTLIIGKDRQLYEQPYLLEYCDLSPTLPPQSLEAEVRLIADLQARLAARNIPFLLLITPSKPALYPEYIPDVFLSRKVLPGRTYDALLPLLDRYRVQYLDTHKLLADLKPTSPAPFYSRGGIHWNELGVARAAIALTDRLAQLLPVPLARLRQAGPATVDTNPVDDNADLARLLNVLSPPKRFQVPHLPLRREGQAPPAPHLFVVAGSYADTLLARLSQYQLFSTIDHYFYWHVYHYRYIAPATPGQPPQITKSPAHPDQLNWETDVFSSTAILLEINETVIDQGPNSHFHAFTTEALKHLPPNPLPLQNTPPR